MANNAKKIQVLGLIPKYTPNVDETLKLSEEGVLGVNTATEVEKDNTLPITAAAVHTAVGNIEILLSTI